MSAVTRHSLPRWRDVVLEQVRIVGRSLRLEAWAVTAILGVGTLVIGIDIARGGPGFDSSDWLPTPLVSFLIPFSLWRRERPFDRALLWTFPVERRRLALARVIAGGVWTMALLAVFALWLLVLGAFAHAPPARTFMRVQVVATATTYLLGNALVLGLRHPLRWLLRVVAFVALIAFFTHAPGMPSRESATRVGIAVGDAWANWDAMPALAQSLMAAILGLGMGAAALWGALSRHGERRRS
jgi:hypothetical protein